MKEEQIKTTLKKNQKADIPTKNGGKYSYQYVDIAQIHEYLEENNMRYIQKIQRIENDDYIMTKRYIEGKWEDEWLQGSRVVQATLQGNNNPAQEQGSALTYARRYSLLMAFGLATEDDDAASLSKKKEVTEEAAKEYVITFGKKHNGHKLTDVIKNDPSFIDWILNNSKDEYLLKCIELLTGQVPLTEEEQKEIVDLMATINKLMVEKGIDAEEIRDMYDVKSSKDMTLQELRDCVEWLKGINEDIDYSGAIAEVEDCGDR